MRKLFLLITIWTHGAAFGQSDTLKSNEIEFEILNSKSGAMDNFDSLISIFVNHADLNKIPKGLIFTHGRNNRPIYRASLIVKPKVNDTILFSYPGEVLPQDKFYLAYESKIIEYLIHSTVSSNNTPHYMDFNFLFNGDTIKSNDYEIVNFKNSRINETTIRIVNFENQRVVKVKYKGETIKIDLLKGQEIKPIFHGLTILGYIDNFRKIAKNVNYSRQADFAKRHNCKKITTFRLFDFDSKLGFEKDDGILCVE